MALILHVGTKHKSSWSLRPFMALAHTGAPFETHTIWLDHGASTREALAKVTPTHKVPVLDHDGLVIWDSLAICEYLAEQFPEAHLWPKDRAARARARAISAEMHAGFAALRRDMPMAILADKAGKGHTDDALVDARRVSEIWHDAIGESGGPFLFGGFTIADAMFAPVTTRFTTYGVPMDDVCHRYVTAVQSTPAFERWKAEAQTELALEPATA
jgi:glutathione S-transferase